MIELCLRSFSRTLHRSFLFLFLFSLGWQLNAGIVFNGSPGTAAPPNNLGGLPMFSFPNDPRTLGDLVNSASVSYDCPSLINFSRQMNHTKINVGWNNWSHGYTGDVYYSLIGGNMTITLPANTRGFYFYMEKNLFGTANLTATANDGTTSGPIPVTTPNGAQYYGFYTTSASCLLTTITVNIPAGNVGFAVGEFGINIDANNGAIACNNNIQISLDENCIATVTPDMVLEGNISSTCPGDFTVVVRDWVTNAIIDIDPITHYPQIGYKQIGHKLKITITDPSTGNNCWGTAFVEDKLAPILTCPRDITLSCLEDVSPLGLAGEASAYEACSAFTVNYSDLITKGGCQAGFDRIITRTWTAVDATGNKSTCVQTITVNLGDLDDVVPPLNFTGLILPNHTHYLVCDEKYDSKFNANAHYRPSPECVDDYLLDKAIFDATGVRVPKLLGWNCIESGAYAGHPNPKSIYYPAHTDPQSCWAANQIVMWEGTGEPSAVGCSNIAITFKDLRIDVSKPGCNAGPVGCYKLLRTWTLLDWCTGEIDEYSQIIKVIDDEGPNVLYPDNLIVNTDPWKCEGRWDVPPAYVVDNCSSEVHYTIRVENGTVLGNENTGYIVVNLPLGIQNAYIVAEDCCGNVTEKLIVIDVQDNTPPNAVCIQKTTVTIGGTQSPGENLAKVFASSFDNGSFDNCAPHIYFKAIRMDELDGTNNGSTKESTVCNKANGDDDSKLAGSQTYFDDNVKFCCADAGNSIRVVFRVFDVDPGVGPITPSRMNSGGDLFGRYSDCMIEVEVQNKGIPTVVAPPDIVVSCKFWFDLNKITDPADATFGKIVNDVAWRTKVSTNDVVCSYFCEENPYTKYPGYVKLAPNQVVPAPNKACDFYNSLFNAAHPDNKYDLTWGFDGYVLSACGTTPTIKVNDLRECGQGRILRTFSAQGPNGILVTATQTIWVVNCDPLYISRDFCDTTDDIVWPDCKGLGTHVNGCGADTDPSVTGRPVILNGKDHNCALIAIEPFDEVFTIEPDACYKILRKWVVIDWCQYDPNIDPTHGRWEFTQVIKVSDKVKPEVTCNVGVCEPAVIDPKLKVCVGHIRLTATAVDSCTPSDWLSHEYKIDAFNNGSVDYTVGTLTKRQFSLGDKPVNHNNPFADDPNNPFDASGTYPIGIHKITWYVEDGCGNIGTCSTLFEIKDCKAPTPYCLTGIITVPMPSSGCVDVWAKDLDFNSYDNCTPKDKLKFYFDGDTAKRSIRVCCADFIKEKASDELRIPVQMWVEDEEGNRDYCTTIVIIQDNQNVCPNPTGLAGITGELKTEEGSNAANVTVDLYMNGQLLKNRFTGANGSYSFPDLSFPQDYTIKPGRNDNPLNGVTTADIVKMQKHILGVETLNSPYKLIAADVNKTNSITASDIAETRKLILGVIPNFTKSPSWIFIPATTTFADPKSPWSYSTDKTMGLKTPSDIANFIAVKIGDVNHSAAANAQGGVQIRTNENLTFEVEETFMKAGDTYKVAFRSNEFNNVSGYQFTINFDKLGLSYVGIEAGELQLTNENFGLTQVENGLITTSWNSNHAISVDKKDVLFTLVFKANHNAALSKSLTISSDITYAEAYDGALNAQGVNLDVRSSNGVTSSGVFELYQNSPNPFQQSTEITFRLPEASPATLTIYDVTGKVHRIYNVKGEKGLNTVSVNHNDLSTSGMFYYQLDAANQTATKRMIILE